MPEHFRAFIVIVCLASAIFYMARRSSFEVIDASDFKRRRNAWFVLTVLAFASHDFWIYTLLASVAIFLVGRREGNPVALFFLLLFVLPVSSVKVPGFGLINYLMEISHLRLLELLILLPAYITIRGRSGVLAFGRLAADKFLLAYLLLSFVLMFRVGSATGALREGVYLFIDVFLPYFVVSRLLRDIFLLREAIFSLFIALMVLAGIAIFEFSRHWLLYSAVAQELDLRAQLFTAYLGRAGMLRASASTGQAIALGFAMALGIGMYLYLKGSIRSRLHRVMSGLLIVSGLLVALSRGPWLGGYAMVLVYLALSAAGLRKLTYFVFFSFALLLILSQLPAGQKAIDLLPFIGSVERGGIDYREKLIDNSMVVIERNVLFGAVDYLQEPEMLEMMQGQGIIDVVNTYVGVALAKGVVGLFLFSGFFVVILWQLYAALQRLADKRHELHRLGCALLATLLGALFIIFTVSSITVIPVLCWSLAGLSVAYIQLVGRLSEEGRPVRQS